MDLNKFIGRKSAYALQVEDGSYICVNEPITKELLEEHIEGKKTIGSYVIREDELLDYGVIDIDGGQEVITDPLNHPLYRFAETIYNLFPDFTRALEFSGRRGYHVWIWTNQPEQPKFIRELIKSRLKKLDIKGIEIYPKQDNLRGLKGYGSMIKIPCGIHRKSKLKSFIIKTDMETK